MFKLIAVLLVAVLSWFVWSSETVRLSPLEKIIIAHPPEIKVVAAAESFRLMAATKCRPIESL